MDRVAPIVAYPMEVLGTDGLNYTCRVDHIADSENQPPSEAWSQGGTDGVTWVNGTAYTKGISDGFPYPQIFDFTKMTIVCGKTKIYEWVNSALVLKLTVAEGQTWRALDFNDFIYMSNGVVSVTRDPVTQVYSVSSQPAARALANYNGQIIIGSRAAQGG